MGLTERDDLFWLHIAWRLVLPLGVVEEVELIRMVPEPMSYDK